MRAQPPEYRVDNSYPSGSTAKRPKFPRSTSTFNSCGEPPKVRVKLFESALLLRSVSALHVELEISHEGVGLT